MSRHHNRLDKSIWNPLTATIKERDGYQCVMCGTEDNLTVDHEIPLDQMTDEDWEDGLPYQEHLLKTLCRSCNSRKGNRTLQIQNWFDREWLSSIQ